MADAATLIEALREEIDKGMINIETAGTRIIIRVREKGSFSSGAAQFRSGFMQVLKKSKKTLETVEGTIVVAGHTDNVPIKTARFRSNWDLSASRAVSVVHELLSEGTLDQKRFVVEGHGDAHPLAPNDSAENRSANRRVEMTIQQGQDSRPKLEEPTAALKVPTSVEVLSNSAAMISTANFAEPTPIVESPQTPNQ